MSYNITNWRTKAIGCLEVPYSQLFDHPRRDFHPHVEIPDPAQPLCLRLLVGEGFIEGCLDGKTFKVVDVDLSGEFSGTFYREVFLPAMQESSGTLKARLVWEGGDSISDLVIHNGKVTESDVE